MLETLTYLGTGMVFGLVAGISPGPLTALILSETLRHGKGGGIKIAIAPAITDIPIIAVSLLLLSTLADFKAVLGGISIIGALYILYLAYECVTIKREEFNIQETGSKSLRKGIITNFLSPHPYLFWISIGAPMVVKARQVNTISAILFTAGFYVLLIGSKISISLVVDRSRGVFNRRLYSWIIRVLGLVLLIYGIIFIKEGLKSLGIIN